MRERFLFVTPTLRNQLSQAQGDAVELAALDTFYTVVTAEWDTALVQRLENDPRHVLLSSAEEIARCLQHGGVLPKTTVLLNFGDARNEPLRDVVGSSALNFVLGASSPALMRALLGSILEFSAGRGFRGILPRLSNSHGLKKRQRTLLSSDERPAVQAFANDCIREIYAQASGGHSPAVPTPEQPWPWPGSQFFQKATVDILDELLMNAIWDANPLFRKVERTETCTLAADKPVTIECASDGISFGLSVEDREGTFPWRALSGPLSFALGLKPELKVNEGPGGAGLGLYMILQRTSILSVEVKPNAYTRVSAILRFDDTVRDMQARPKSVLVFFEDLT